MTKRILLTAGRLPFALELARSLSRAGALVFVADCYPCFVSQASSAVAASFRVPSPENDFPGFRQRILEIVALHSIELVIPVSEEVLYLAVFRRELESRCEVFFPDFNLLHTVHHKQRFVSFCADQGLATPQTAVYRGQATLPSFTQEPYVIKRSYSRAGGQVVFPKAGRHPSSYGLPSDGSWILQEKAQGEPICSLSVVRNGRVALTRLYRPVSALGTVSVVFRRVKHSAVEKWIEDFAAKTGYEGVVSFDFFATETAAVAIECNPRPTSGLHLCEPALLASAILNEPKPLRREPERLRAQIFLAFLLALPLVIRRGQFKALLPELLRARDVIFSWRDPLPFFYQFICTSYIAWRALRSGKPFVGCMMEGVEWNEDRPALLAYNSMNILNNKANAQVLTQSADSI